MKREEPFMVIKGLFRVLAGVTNEAFPQLKRVSQSQAKVADEIPRLGLCTAASTPGESGNKETKRRSGKCLCFPEGIGDPRRRLVSPEPSEHCVIIQATRSQPLTTGLSKGTDANMVVVVSRPGFTLAS
ncbi:hypothetical protein DPEC_G00091070 [Dallia pectoralis]|uniref:Uncharacterized protein n=1 Tax=Dallia pectoralis TaxID=75939 RepID=A0ACC2H1J7_DALPE|nr:hypothetical protein DPEC_G00091070 [Dallia pectoralis]